MRESPKAISNDLRRFERLCLEQADLCVLEESREALQSLAGDYRKAADRVPTAVETVGYPRRKSNYRAVSMGLTGLPFRQPADSTLLCEMVSNAVWRCARCT
jgi:hypothetical protein